MAVGRDRQQLGQQHAGIGAGDPELDEALVDAVEARLGAQRPVEVKPELDQLDDGQERAVFRVGRGAHDELVDIGIRDLPPELLDEPGLPDPRLTQHRHEARLAGASRAPVCLERGALCRTADVAGERTAHLEPRLRAARPGHPPEPQRMREALEVALPQRLAAEVAPDDAPGRIAHGKRPGIRLRLHASGDVRRVPLGEVLVLRADRSDHDPPRVHPDAHLEPPPGRPSGAAVARVHLAQDVESAPHGSTGVVLVRAREPEVDDDAVAEVLGDVAVVMGNRVQANALVVGDEVAQVLGIEGL